MRIKYSEVFRRDGQKKQKILTLHRHKILPLRHNNTKARNNDNNQPRLRARAHR